MRFLVQRSTRLLMVFILATLLCYCLLNLLPGNIVDVMIGEVATGDTAARDALLQQMGLDRPVLVRYAQWFLGALRGDFGRSALTSQPVSEAIVQRLPATIELIVLSQVIAIALAVPVGIWSAYRRSGVFDRAVSGATFIMLSMPSFVTGVILLFAFSVLLKVFPAAGYASLLDNPWQNLRSYALPATTVAMVEIAVLIRVLRSDVIDVLQEDYVAFARAKGLGATYILYRHALRPASINMLTMIGLQIGSVISGSVITERLFSIPGLGSLLIQSIQSHDDTMVQGVVTVMVVLSVLVNLMVDVVYALIDPRVSRVA